MNKKILATLVVITLAIPTISANAASLRNKNVAQPTIAILDTALDTSLPIFKDRILFEACVTQWSSCPNGLSQMEGQQEDKPSEAEIAVQGQLQIEREKAAAQLQQEQLRSQNDVIIEREKIAAQAELERFKAQLKAETDLAIAQIKAQSGMMYGG